MNWIKKQKEEQYKSINFKNFRRTINVLNQVGRSNLARDKSRKALLPGKRISKNGKEYWETRKNRSDLKGSRV